MTTLLPRFDSGFPPLLRWRARDALTGLRTIVRAHRAVCVHDVHYGHWNRRTTVIGRRVTSGRKPGIIWIGAWVSAGAPRVGDGGARRHNQQISHGALRDGYRGAAKNQND